jgi:NAD-dependent dihydropyrimidine dehydrogenase PreA subunit
MSVYRNNLDSCIGCGTCVKVCPKDVMYLDEEKGKSVIAYVRNCISCGQCWLNCPTDSIFVKAETESLSLLPIL